MSRFGLIALAGLTVVMSACGAPRMSDATPGASATTTAQESPEAVARHGLEGLAFIREVKHAGERTSPGQVMVVGADGIPRQITRYDDRQGDFGGASSVTWSPDGTRLAVSIGYLSVRTEVMDPDGSNVVKLRAGWAVEWSPDGRRLVMLQVIDAVGPGFNPSVHVVDAATGEVTDIGFGWSPHWLDDSTVIAFRAVGMDENNAGEPTLFRIPADGSGAEQVMNTSYTDAIPSPDGSRMAFVSETGTCGEPCHRVSIRKGDGVVTVDRALGPVWSPDSSRVALRTGDLEMHAGVFDVASGSLLRTDYAAFWLTWSPDGTKLALGIVDHDEQGHVIVIDATTGEEIGRAPGKAPSWGPAVAP